MQRSSDTPLPDVIYGSDSKGRSPVWGVLESWHLTLYYEKFCKLIILVSPVQNERGDMVNKHIKYMP